MRLLGEFLFALRGLLRTPGFTLVAVTTLALGIGANGASFNVVDAYLLRLLPYPHPNRVVVVDDMQPGYGEAPASYDEWRDLKERGRMFEELTAYFSINVNYAGGERPEPLRMMLVAERYFDLVGLAPVAGRRFVPDEEREGGAPAVIVSESFWKTRLGRSAVP